MLDEIPNAIPEAFDRTFLKMDEVLKENGVSIPGCTIVTAFINTVDGKSVLHTANAGDARVVLRCAHIPPSPPRGRLMGI